MQRARVLQIGFYTHINAQSEVQGVGEVPIPPKLISEKKKENWSKDLQKRKDFRGEPCHFFGPWRLMPSERRCVLCLLPAPNKETYYV